MPFYLIASERELVLHHIPWIQSFDRLPLHVLPLLHAIRLMRRADAPFMESLPSDYEFKCADVGVECSVEMLILCEFLPTARIIPFQLRRSPLVDSL